MQELGGVQTANGEFGRWVALARIMDRFGEAELRDYATYELARTALRRLAQAKYVRFFYDDGLFKIEEEPDWMVRMSTSPGESGHSMLWAEHWAGADDDVRQLVRWDEFGPLISQVYLYNVNPELPTFNNLTAECGRFLWDHAREDCSRFIGAVELNAPDWHLVHRPPYLGNEISCDSPRNGYTVFLGKCYAQGVSGEEMLRYQDVPFVKTGDLYHIGRLVANLRCFGGLSWQ
jgi:hypothetical protein